MKYHYSKSGLKKKERLLQRAFEILPGLTSWAILAGIAGLSFCRPLGGAIAIIAFYLYWLLRMLYTSIFLGISFLLLKIQHRADWVGYYEGIDRLDETLEQMKKSRRKQKWSRRVSQWIYRRELLRLKQSKSSRPASSDIVHLVIYPVAAENYAVLKPAIDSLREQKFPVKKICVVYALEERAGDTVKTDVGRLAEEYRDDFLRIMTVRHPDGVPGEARVKGANITHAAKQAMDWLDSRNIKREHIIVSCFDADTVVGRDYFSCLTYQFMVQPDRLRSSFQPIPVYHNNIWVVPGFVRVIETGASLFQLVEATDPGKLVTFSSHSISGKALADVGYWPVDMISDDSAIYWKSLIHYDGKFQVVPMPVTLSMDMAGDAKVFLAARSVYKQKRRWAWGVENFPLVMRAFIKKSSIPIGTRIFHAFKLYEGHVSWATWGFLLTILGWLPGLLARNEYASTVAYYNAPAIAGMIFRFSTIALFVSVFVSVGMLPRIRSEKKVIRRISHVAEWILMPVALVFFSALPALDAQTRLMLGKRMEFSVTEKSRKKNL